MTEGDKLQRKENVEEKNRAWMDCIFKQGRSPEKVTSEQTVESSGYLLWYLAEKTVSGIYGGYLAGENSP